MKKVIRFLIQNRKGVKKMRKYLIVMIAVIMATLSLNSVLLADTSDAVAVTATVAAAVRSIEISPATIAWDMPAGTMDAHCFISPEIEIKFYGGNQAGGYKIRAYTSQASTNGLGYLISGSDELYLKGWCVNFGPRLATEANPPAPVNNYFWNGYDFNGDGDSDDTGSNDSLTGTYDESVLDFDINGNGTKTDTITVAASGDDPDTFTATFYHLGEGPSYSWMANQADLATYEVKLATDAGPLDTPFKVRLAADVAGVPSGTYTGGVTFDIVTR